MNHRILRPHIPEDPDLLAVAKKMVRKVDEERKADEKRKAGEKEKSRKRKNLLRGNRLLMFQV